LRRAQHAGKVARIGYLGFGAALAWAPRVESMRAGLRDLGYSEGKNIAIEFRWAETVSQLRDMADDLVAKAGFPCPSSRENGKLRRLALTRMQSVVRLYEPQQRDWSSLSKTKGLSAN
jgi:hypothetical protein